jgi:predicted acylesterase/phospholipase RssA
LAKAGAPSCHVSSASLENALGAGAAAVNRGESGDSRILELCDGMEREHSIVIYESDPVYGAWTERCIRQADLVLLVGDAAGSPEPGPIERRALAGQRPGSTELVLLQSADEPPSTTIEWLRHRSMVGHHHVHRDRADSYERLARFVTGSAAGLVLSGGGARGFAHIGVIKALREAAIAVDVIGGSSMGAIIAAQHAAGFDVDAMIELNRRSFSGSDLSDLTVPTVALRRARSTVRNLRSMFGERQIEDLPISYFCISSDLTQARVRVHDRGPLWLWTRASCAIPGLVPPVPSEGSLLVDGGLLNNLPADVMRHRCSGAVIAVNVTPTVDLAVDTPLVAEMSGWPHLWPMLRPSRDRRPFPNIAQILSRTVFVGSVRDAHAQAQHSDLYLEPELAGVGMGDFAAIDRIVEEGYRHAAVQIAAWPAQARGRTRSST